MVTLQTDRLTLRVRRESDFDTYAQMCADPEVISAAGIGTGAAARTAAARESRNT